MLKIFVIRHGQDEDNANGILNGHRDKPLTTIGISQANEAAENIKNAGLTFNKVYSSPLQRAYKTAEIVTDKLDIPKPLIYPELIEHDFGVMTGKPICKITELCAPDILVTGDITYFLKAKDAETFPQLLERASGLLEKIRLTHKEGNILLVTHGSFGKMIYAAYYSIDWQDALKLFHFGNSELLELSDELDANKPHLDTIPQYNV